MAMTFPATRRGITPFPPTTHLSGRDDKLMGVPDCSLADEEIGYENRNEGGKGGEAGGGDGV
jgi:hypothetical protein